MHIKQWLKKNDYYGCEIADMIGMHYNTFSDYVVGGKSMKLAQALMIYYLTGGEVNPEGFLSEKDLAKLVDIKKIGPLGHRTKNH